MLGELGEKEPFFKQMESVGGEKGKEGLGERPRNCKCGPGLADGEF